MHATLAHTAGKWRELSSTRSRRALVYATNLREKSIVRDGTRGVSIALSISLLHPLLSVYIIHTTVPSLSRDNVIHLHQILGGVWQAKSAAAAAGSGCSYNHTHKAPLRETKKNEFSQDGRPQDARANFKRPRTHKIHTHG